MTAEPDDNIETRAARQLIQNQPNAVSLDPRYLPRSYPEMLQDIIAIHARLEKLDSTDAKVMVLLLGMASVVAEEQLDKIARNAIGRMIGGSHAV